MIRRGLLDTPPGELGVDIFLDDFGTGYSSLDYFRRLPAQEIKIDRSFVKDMLDDADDSMIVSAIISLSKSFKRRLVAEGIESADVTSNNERHTPGCARKGERSMIGYVTIGVSDMERAKKFYTDLLGDMGAKLLLDLGRIAFIGKSMKSPMLAVCTPFDGTPNHPGNGNMLALQPGSKEAVDTYYQKAIKLGATCDGEPGQRIPDQFYGAYVKDLDGNKLAFFHFG